MSSFTFPDRESFLNKNIRIESLNHPRDYSVIIDDLYITLNVIDDDFFLHIDETCDFLAVTNADIGNDVVKLFNEFKHKLLLNEEVDCIYVSNCVKPQQLEQNND